MRKIFYLAVLISLFGGGAAFAHHSFAMFDQAKVLTLQGTVKEWQWTNPHAWLTVEAASPGRPEVQSWSIEGGSLQTLRRGGFTRDAVKPGDKIIVTIHPRRDGAAGGALMAVTTADGRVMGRPGETGPAQGDGN